MKVRKISASYILDGFGGFLKNGILNLTEDGSILELTDTGGNLTEIANLEHYNGILCPGFINAHCHLELSHLRGKIPRKTGLPGFIKELITGRKSDKEAIQRAITDADREMRVEGIVAVGDICNTADSFETKAHSPIYYHSFVEIFGTSSSKAHDIHRNAQNLVQQARHKFSLKACITPHSAYSLNDLLFQLIREEKDSQNNILSVHNQETESENELISNATGELHAAFEMLGFDLSEKTPQNINSFPWLMRQLPANKTILLVHNLFTSEQDIKNSGIENADVYWVLCPGSNFYIAGLSPGKYLMDNYSPKICIGTDSLASNDRLSILNELNILQSKYPEIPLYELLTWATLNGAKALGIDKWCGSFEKGKKPGVLLIENADIQNLKLNETSRIKVLA